MRHGQAGMVSLTPLPDPPHAVSIVAVAVRLHTISSKWDEMLELGETDAAVLVRRAALVASACGAVGRAVVSASPRADAFWAANRGLNVWNGGLILVSSGALYGIESPPTYMPGNMKLTSSIVTGVSFVAMGAAFHVSTRRHIRSIASALYGLCGRVACVV